jgi:hypothetical protein
MAICGNCGAETSRLRTHFENPEGKALRESRDSCPHCHPEEFVEQFLDPSERRFHLAHEVNPNEYDTLIYDDGEVVPCVKDWARGEFEQRLIDAPEAAHEQQELVDRKREFARERNQRSLTPEEIESRVSYFRQAFAEADQLMRAQEAGLILPN